MSSVRLECTDAATNSKAKKRKCVGLSKTQLRQLVAGISAGDHDSYRSYLSAVYEAAKEADPTYSFVRLSADLGLSSTNAHSIIKGRRALSEKSASRICDQLSLAATDRRYFLSLVRQEHAKSNAERESAFQERLGLKLKNIESDIDRRRLAFFEHWYHAAILELLRIEDASDQPQWIAAHLQPEISLVKIKHSLELLTSLNYLTFDKTRNRLYPSETRISTGDQVAHLAIQSYHRQMLDLALQAMDQIAAEERDVSAITLRVSAKLRKQFHEELVALRKKFLQLAEQESDGETIIQMNFQLFPLNKKRTGT